MSKKVYIDATSPSDNRDNWIAVNKMRDDIDSNTALTGAEVDLSGYVTDSEFNDVENSVSTNTNRINSLEQQMADPTDSDAIHDNVAAEINAITEKGTPVDADLIIIEDSADSNNKKKAQVGNLPSGSGTKEFLFAVLSADHSTNIDAGDEIQFDTVSASSGSNISLNTTTHQFTLKDGGKYKVRCVIDGTWSAIGYTSTQVYDITNSAYVGVRGTVRTTTYDSHRSAGADCFAVIEPSGDTVYELRIYTEDNFTLAWSDFCYLMIEKF